MMTHEQLRLRVFRADFAHGFAAFFWRDGIHDCLDNVCDWVG
jgi:hypothetical protein